MQEQFIAQLRQSHPQEGLPAFFLFIIPATIKTTAAARIRAIKIVEIFEAIHDSIISLLLICFSERFARSEQHKYEKYCRICLRELKVKAFTAIFENFGEVQ